MELVKGGVSKFKETEVGVLPKDWEVNELSHYFSYISYGFTNPMPTVSDGVFMITANDIKNSKINYETARKTSYEAYKNFISDKSRPRANDILLTKDGTLGRLAIVDETEICINQSVAVIRPNEKVDPRFLKALLESSYYQRTMVENAGGSAIKHIYITIVDKMMVGIPPTLKEQKAIATALSDMDNLINCLEKIITKKKAIKQGAMQQLLTPPSKGGKRLPGFSGEWNYKRLDEISNIKTGSKNNQDKIEDAAYPFYVRSQTVERINTYSYDCEAILIPGEGGIGTIFHYINGKFDVHQRVYKISDFNKDISGRFVFYQLVQNFYDHAMKNSVKATVDSLRLPTFQEFEISIPDGIEEQKTIVSVLDDMDNEINILKAKKSKYEQLKQGMMQELLTGKTRLV